MSLEAETGPAALRAFIAAELPQNVKARVAALQDELRGELGEGVKARWTRPEALHLTLKFLGAIPAATVDEVAAALARAAQGEAPFALRLGGLGSFGRRGSGEVLWIGLNGELGRLHEFQARLEAQLEDGLAGLVPKEPRPFRPHLTLARFAKGVSPPLAPLPARTPLEEAFTVDRLVLFRSELAPRGPRYTPLASLTLPP